MKNLNEIAKSISELESMPEDDSYYKVCVDVGMDLYELTYDDAIKIADIIQEKYLQVNKMRHGKDIFHWSKDEIDDIIDFYTATTADHQFLSTNPENFYKNNKTK